MEVEFGTKVLFAIIGLGLLYGIFSGRGNGSGKSGGSGSSGGSSSGQ